MQPNKFHGVIAECYKRSRVSLCESQEGVPAGMLRVTGVAAKIGVKNRNNRIYTEDNYCYWIDKLQAQINAGQLLGELEHPESDNIDMNNVSHRIERLWYDKATKTVYITLILLDTPKGKIAQSVVKSGGPIHVSSRANGSVDNNGYAIIDDLITFDIVGTPGFIQSDLNISESFKLPKSEVVRIYESADVDTVMWTTPTQRETNRCSLVEALSSNAPNSINSNNNKRMSRRTKKAMSESIRRAKAALMERRNRGGQDSLSMLQSKQIMNWMFESFAPAFINYLAEAGAIRINEAKAKTTMSPKAYFSRILEEAEKPEIGTTPLDPVKSPIQDVNTPGAAEEGEKEITEIVELVEAKTAKRKEIRESLAKLRKKLHEEKDEMTEEEIEDLKEEIEDLKEDEEDIKKDIEEAEEKLEECDDKDALKESLRNRRRSARSFLRESKECLKEGEEGLTEEEKADIQEDIKNLEEEVEDVKDAIENVDEDDQDDPEGHTNPAIKECNDKPLTEEEIANMTEEELENYIKENDEAGDEPETPTNEEEASPFLQEARRNVRRQSTLIEALRRNAKKKKTE